MKYQCTECDVVKGSIEEFDCKDRNHKYQKILDENDRKKFDEETKRNDRFTFEIETDTSKTTVQILDHKIRNLRPQTFIPEKNQKMILVYLPTKQEIQKGNGKSTIKNIDFSNSAFFVTSKPKNSIGLQRNILHFQDKDLVSKFKIDVLPNWNDVRWEISDLKSWLNETKPSEPSGLYTLLDQTRRKIIELATEHEYVKSNLWDIGTYFYELFDAFPYNDYTGTKRAGKSKSLLFQKLVCYNPIMSVDITGSATFRLIEGLGATLLLDETEQFKNQRNDQAQQVRTILNQGFLKDQIAVRSEGREKGGFTPVPYNLYSPKSLAHINSFDDVLEERCIQQINKRALDPKIRNSWPTEKDSAFQKIRNLCYRLFLDHADEIYNLQDEARTLLSLSGRELQLWTPIITLALFFEKHGIPGLVDKIKESARQSSEDRQIQDEQESKDLRVLRFLDEQGITLAKDHDIIKGNPEGWVPIGKLFDHLTQTSENYEIDMDFFSSRTLSQTLKRLGFKTSRKEAGYSWFITKDSVSEVKQRMDYGVLDNQKVALTITSFASEGSAGSDLGIKSENTQASEGSARFSQNTHETEQTERAELTEHETRDTNQSSSEAKTELLNMTEHIQSTAKFSHVQPRMCKCSCGALFHENDTANKVKFKDYHENQGHKVEFVTEDDQ